MRLLLLTSLVCCLGVSAPPEGSKQFDADLTSLEGRFFFHDYTGETAAERLDRLDQLVFGHVRSGSAEKRMTSLLLTVPNIEANSVQPNCANTQQKAVPFKSEKPQLDNSPSPAADTSPSPEPGASPSSVSGASPSSVSGASPSSVSGANPSSVSDTSPTSETAPDPSNDYYPTVTALEEQIAHKTEILLPVQERLARLEKIAFGQPSTSKDLSARVDRLKEYVSQKNGGNEDYLTNSNAVSLPYADTGLNAEVSSMEKQVFGKTYGRDSLSSRLTRLEQDLLPQQPPQTFTPIQTRVNTLMAALSNRNSGPINGSNVSTAYWPSSNYNSGQTFNSSGYGQQQQSAIATARNGNRPKGHPLLRKLGVALGEVGAMAARSMMYGGYGYY